VTDFPRSGTAQEIFTALRSAPFVPLARLTGGGAVLVVAPHADDETLGCGGLMASAVQSGTPVLIDILTDGSGSHPGSRTHPPERLAALRREEELAAARTLGIDPDCVHFGVERDGYLGRDERAAAAVVKDLTRRIDHFGIAAVFVTCVADPHPDHAAAFRLARRAVQDARSAPALFAYPIWLWSVRGDIPLDDSSVEGRAVAAYRLDIAAHLDAKRQAIDCHGSQLGRVIQDCPDGFTLRAADLAPFLQPHETFVAYAP